MSRSRTISLTALVLVVAPSLALAADQVPTREGNIWDWRNHEPVPSEVHRLEQSAGIAAPPAQQEKATGDVESLYNQLMKSEPVR